MWQSQNGYYYYKNQSLGTKSKNEAKKRQKALKYKEFLEKNGIYLEPKKSTITFKELTNRYYNVKKQILKNPKNLIYTFKKCKPLNGKKVQEISTEDIKAVFKETSKGSQHHHYKQLSIMWNWAKKNNYVDTNIIPSPPSVHRTSVIKPKEFAILIDNIHLEEFRQLVEFAYKSGARQSECLNNIVWEKHRIILHGKTGERFIPYENPLWSLYAYKNLQWDYSRYYVSHKFKEFIRMLDMSEKYCFETLRHSFGSLMVHEADIYKTSMLMGHASVTTTEKYLHLPFF